MSDAYTQSTGFVDTGTTGDGRVRISIGTKDYGATKADTTALVTPKTARQIAHDIFYFADQAEKQKEEK